MEERKLVHEECLAYVDGDMRAVYRYDLQYMCRQYSHEYFAIRGILVLPETVESALYGMSLYTLDRPLILFVAANTGLLTGVRSLYKDEWWFDMRAKNDEGLAVPFDVLARFGYIGVFGVELQLRYNAVPEFTIRLRDGRKIIDKRSATKLLQGYAVAYDSPIPDTVTHVRKFDLQELREQKAHMRT